MKQVEDYPVCYDLAYNYLSGKDVTLRATWIDGDMPIHAHASKVTTHMTVIRAWTIDGAIVHTREMWEHDNGYRAEFSIISKAEFLHSIYFS